MPNDSEVVTLKVDMTGKVMHSGKAKKEEYSFEFAVRSRNGARLSWIADAHYNRVVNRVRVKLSACS